MLGRMSRGRRGCCGGRDPGPRRAAPVGPRSARRHLAGAARGLPQAVAAAHAARPRGIARGRLGVLDRGDRVGLPRGRGPARRPLGGGAAGASSPSRRPSGASVVDRLSRKAVLLVSTLVRSALVVAAVVALVVDAPAWVGARARDPDPARRVRVPAGPARLAPVAHRRTRASSRRPTGPRARSTAWPSSSGRPSAGSSSRRRASRRCSSSPR